ncbi:MAG: outer membrane beta-barrel protein [Acidobacteria bacterium]|nr:outer membrane beta-barrel protein [Acidobacteriota bacterium]
MMRKKIAIGVLALVLLALLPDLAFAQIPLQTHENKWEISFFGGGAHLGDTDSLVLTGQAPSLVELQTEPGYSVGARVTENFGNRAGAELEYAVSNHPMAFVNLSANLPRLDLSHRVHKVVYSLLFYSAGRPSKIRPFGSVGVGASFFRLGEGSGEAALQRGVALKNRWKLAFSYGGGVKLHLSRNWGVRLDARNQISGIPDYGLPPAAQGATGAAFRPDGLFQNWQLTAGVMYSFNVQ